MEEASARLAAEITKLSALKQPKRFIVGIAGAPGSGKTTIAAQLIKVLSKTTENGLKTQPQAVAIPMDGFHYTRAQLDAFEDPVEAHKRRGAPFTFDVHSVVDFVAKLQDEPRTDLFAPSFDHAVKDPVSDDICIPASASIVILEGNYLLLDSEHWRDIGVLLDYKVLIQVSREEARRRVAKRHVAAGIAPTLELGEARFDENDWPNGELIMANAVPYDVLVESRPDATAGTA